MDAHPIDASDEAIKVRAKRRARAEASKLARAQAKAIGKAWKLKLKAEKAQARAEAKATGRAWELKWRAEKAHVRAIARTEAQAAAADARARKKASADVVRGGAVKVEDGLNAYQPSASTQMMLGALFGVKNEEYDEWRSYVARLKSQRRASRAPRRFKPVYCVSPDEIERDWGQCTYVNLRHQRPGGQIGRNRKSISLLSGIVPYPTNLELKDDECINGFLTRVVIDTGAPSITFLAKQANVIRKQAYSFEDCARLARLLEVDAFELYYRGPSTSRQVGVIFNDAVIDQTAILRFGRRICPICIREDAYSRAVWNLRAVRSCHHHEVQLVDRCHGCNIRLSWAGGALSGCHGCGADLIEAPATPVPSDQLLASRLLVHGMLSDTVPDGLPAAMAGLKGPLLAAALYAAAEINVWLNEQAAGCNSKAIHADDLPHGIGSEVELWLAGGLDLLCQPPDEIRIALREIRGTMGIGVLTRLRLAFAESGLSPTTWPVLSVIMEELAAHRAAADSENDLDSIAIRKRALLGGKRVGR